MAFRWRADRIGRKADAWIARLQGPDREMIAAEVEAWRAADPRHEAAFRRSESLWREAGSATRTSPIVEHVPARSMPARINRGPRLAFGGVVAIVAFGACIFLLERPTSDRLAIHAEIASQSDPQTIHLSDGSTVVLGANSLIATNFDGVTRAISLERGNARFSVAHDPAHPFVVTAGGRTVTARGTIFEVALRPAGLSVTMIEGVVEIARQPRAGLNNTGVIRLAHGERLVVSGGAERVSTNSVAELPTARDYPSTSLARIVADANAGATKPIRLSEPTLGGDTVEGRFDLSDTVALAQQLAAALELDLHDDGHSLILSRRPVLQK